MAEVLVEVDPAVHDTDGAAHVARICGREAEGGRWDGWIEFEPVDGGPVLRTERETRQPNLPDLEYWAGGLTMAYLEGALKRAMEPRTAQRPDEPRAHPVYEGPAPAPPDADDEGGAPRTGPGAVLDPFAVHAQGEEVLREELSALDEGHLRNIIRAHDLADDDGGLDGMDREALAALIVAAVRRGAG